MNLSSALCAKEKLGFLYKIPRTIFVTKGLLAAFFQRKPLFFVPSERLKLHVTYLERAYSLFRTSFQTSVSPVFLTHNNFWPWVAYIYQTTTRGHWLFSNKSSIACGFEPKLTGFGYQNYNPFMSFFLLFINKLYNLSPSLFRKKKDCMCVAEKLFKMPPILRWSSFVPLADAAASSTSLQKLNIPKKNLQDEEMPIVESIKRLLKLG